MSQGRQRFFYARKIKRQFRADGLLKGGVLCEKVRGSKASEDRRREDTRMWRANAKKTKKKYL